MSDGAIAGRVFRVNTNEFRHRPDTRGRPPTHLHISRVLAWLGFVVGVRRPYARTSRGRNLIVRHGVIVGLALIAVLVPFFTGTSQEHFPQIVSSSWLRSVSTPSEAAYACAAADACLEDLAEAEPIDATSTPAPQEPDEPLEPTPTVEPEPTPYIEPWATMEVRPGDTLSDLAQWFGVSTLSIAAANGAGVEDFIQIGDTLVIPVVESAFVMPPEPVLPTPEETAAQTPEPVTPTPTPTPYVISGPQEVIDAICSLPWPCDQMVRIASCESGLNPNAFNPAGYYGLFQINFMFDGWNDPLVNAQVAYETKYLPALASGDPLGPWPACRYY